MSKKAAKDAKAAMKATQQALSSTAAQVSGNASSASPSVPIPPLLAGLTQAQLAQTILQLQQQVATLQTAPKPVSTVIDLTKFATPCVACGMLLS